MLKGLHHVGVIVEDMDRSLAFYQGTLGGTIGLDLLMDLPEFAAGVGIAGAKARIVFMQLPAMSPALELIQYSSPAQKRAAPVSTDTLGSVHVAFQTADIKQTYDWLTGKGVHFISGPSAFPADHPQLGGIKFCYFRDPDGALLELIEVPQ
jgi:catechol 2,3-dioxygenase-like lactoylglutathione lyase family enzyme